MFYPVGRLMDRRGRKWAAIPALTLMSLGMATIPPTSDALTLGAVAAVLGFANGMSTGDKHDVEFRSLSEQWTKCVPRPVTHDHRPRHRKRTITGGIDGVDHRIGAGPRRWSQALGLVVPFCCGVPYRKPCTEDERGVPSCADAHHEGGEPS